MFKKYAVLIFLGAALSIAPISKAFADSAGAPGKEKVWAAGEFEVHGDGKLLIRNVSKTKIMIKGKGKIIYLPKEDALLFVHFKGNVKLFGKAFDATFKGGPVVFHALGKGTFWLKGKGLFKIHDKPVQKWPLKMIKKFEY